MKNTTIAEYRGTVEVPLLGGIDVVVRDGERAVGLVSRGGWCRGSSGSVVVVSRGG